MFLIDYVDGLTYIFIDQWIGLDPRGGPVVPDQINDGSKRL